MQQEKARLFYREIYFMLESRNPVKPAQAGSLQQSAEFKNTLLLYLLRNTVGTEEIENGLEEEP